MRNVNGHFFVGPEHAHRQIAEVIPGIQAGLDLRRYDLQRWLVLVQPQHFAVLHAAHEIRFRDRHFAFLFFECRR